MLLSIRPLQTNFNFSQNLNSFILENAFENVSILPWPQCVNYHAIVVIIDEDLTHSGLGT